MDRRDFLRLGLGGAALAGCGVAGPSRGPAEVPLVPWPPPDMDAFLGRLDSNMATIRDGNPMRDAFDRTLLGEPVLAAPQLRSAEDLTRKSLRSLLLAGSVGDLPAEARTHPGIVDRLTRGLDEMDEATLGVTAHLEQLDPARRKAIQGRLRADPGLGMSIVEAFDTEASAIGVSLQRRTHLRSIATQVTWRLNAQPLSTFVDESSAKVRNIAERQYDRVLSDIRDIEPGKVSTVGKPGSATMRVGAILLGVGAGVGLLGLAIASGGSIGGVFVVTAGALLLLGGLIVLIVGAAMNASE
jgi:hypothetical protein